MGFLIRSGIQILGSYPRLYWNVHCRPGTEWIKFTRKAIPGNRTWITLEQEVDVSPWLGQPGGKHLGLGRHWHFLAALGWLLNGIIYIVLLFITGQWQTLIPTSWSIFPAAWHTFIGYISFHRPPLSDFHPLDPLQQLAYADVVFLLGPFLILTGALQSPAIEAQVPWLVRLLGGRQSVRSLHFLGLLAFIAFVIVHVLMVLLAYFDRNMSEMVFGDDGHGTAGIIVGLAIVAFCIAAWAITTIISLRRPC